MRFRKLNKWIAKSFHYFWLPCPLCKQYFGGHEWIPRNDLSSTVDFDGSAAQAICPDCTKSGRGTKIERTAK